MSESLEELILNEYAKIEQDNASISDKNRINILSNIIQIKIENPRLLQFHEHYSIDIKKLLLLYVDLDKQAPLNYDDIDVDSIMALLSRLRFDEKIHVIDFFMRQLKIGHYSKEMEYLNKLKSKIKLKHYMKNVYKIKYLYLFIITFPFYNKLCLIVSFFLVYVVYYIFTLPAFFENFVFFKINYADYSNNFYFNHFLNTAAGIFGLNESTHEIYPINPKGVGLAIFAKCIFFFVFTNSLLIRITENLKK